MSTMREQVSYSYVALLAIFVIWAVAAMTIQRESGVEQDARQYCHMVHAHQQNPSTGWPDFHHDYAKQCNADGTVNWAYVYEK